MLHPLTGQPIDPNTDLDDETSATRLAVSDLLMAVGKGLFLVFLGYIVVDSLPVQLLIPNWQLAFAARLLSISSIPLVGFACVHLAVILNPANRLYSQRLGTHAAIGHGAPPSVSCCLSRCTPVPPASRS